MVTNSYRTPIHLRELEEEAMYVMREAAGQFERPHILFSGGKDSITLAHLAARAFAPMASPFPLLHVDTGHNFLETVEFRDEFANRMGMMVVVRLVQDSIDQGRAVEERGPRASRNGLQSITLMDAIHELKIDAAIGGARRDEERARAKERFFSHRDSMGQWDPKNQRPELWRHFNGNKHQGEHFRIFPLSNWTELDIWEYLLAWDVPLPRLYYAHEREVFLRDGVLYAKTGFMHPEPDETLETRVVRFRTVGDATCTGAMPSDASTLEEVLAEVRSLRVSERAGRGDDKRSDAAMEDRKKQGYF
jgi:sulfate adenylyltransferase subunit 2